MRTIIVSLVTVALAFAVSAEAKPKKKAKAAKVTKKKAPSAQEIKQTTLGIEKLMGAYKWGIPSSKVMSMLERDISNEMDPQIKTTSDPLAQDKLRREKFDKIKDLKKSQVRFDGKQTPWDISMVDKEFAHKNSESMAVVWTKKDRRFFFFHNDKLYKMYIAFNADMFQDKTFEDFAQVMETRFGKAERKFHTSLKGDKIMDHLAWPPTGTTLLRAIDNTKLYSNFCLVLVDKAEQENVSSGRKINSPRKKYNDPLVDMVTKDDKDGGSDSEEDIVDRITKRTSKSPTVGDGDVAAPTPKANITPRKPGNTPDAPPPTKKQKKVNAKNPLDGLDI
jgi:hypothetical protein